MTALPFDTHCHIQDPKLAQQLGEIVLRAGELDGMALCGYDAPSNEAALRIAESAPNIVPALGFHPHEADDVTEAMLLELESLVADPRVVAIGEIGLDFYRNLSADVNQRRLIDRQLEMALAVRKPVCVHTRSAESEALEHLGPYARQAKANGLRIPGVMHCFGGTLEQALPYVEAGFLVSVACTITYPKNDDVRRLVSALPLDALVIETDSPYLPPQGMRGQLNVPANVVEAARGIAAARGDSLERVLEATTANARNLFQLPAANARTAAA